jgi:hypothetical protein
MDKNEKYKKIVSNVSNLVNTEKDKSIRNSNFIFGKGGK